MTCLFPAPVSSSPGRGQALGVFHLGIQRRDCSWTCPEARWSPAGVAAGDAEVVKTPRQRRPRWTAHARGAWMFTQAAASRLGRSWRGQGHPGLPEDASSHLLPKGPAQCSQLKAQHLRALSAAPRPSHPRVKMPPLTEASPGSSSPISGSRGGVQGTLESGQGSTGQRAVRTTASVQICSLPNVDSAGHRGVSAEAAQGAVQDRGC